MQRLRIARTAAVMMLSIGAVVAFFSPEIQPRVGGFRPIEEIWALEDERMESGEPLIAALSCNGLPLAYETSSDTYYCTLGLNRQDEWPELDIRASGVPGLSLCFADDYTWDSCKDALAEGWSYRLFAWTEDRYRYVNIVFTGLPTAVLTTDGHELSRLDSPGHLQISAFAEPSLDCDIRLHLRGGVSYRSEKKSYRVDILRSAGGKKALADVPAFVRTNTLILASGAHDDTLVRERLGWTLWGRIAPENMPFGERRTAYCELFMDGAYQGVYLLMEPIVPTDELAMAGAGALGDSLYRTKSDFFITGERPSLALGLREYTSFVCYYAPTEDSFSALTEFTELETEADDARFLEKARRVLDVDSFMDYDLFIQAGGMTDSVYNNLWIWAHETGEGPRYRLACWDLDTGWGGQNAIDIGSYYEYWVCLPVWDRLLNLDPAVRERFASRWRELQSLGFTESDTVALAEGLASDLKDSGGWRRNAQRWGIEDEEPPIWRMTEYASMRFAILEQAMERILRNPAQSVPFLAASEYDGGKGVSIYEEE